MLLGKKNKDCVIYRGKKYRINCSYDIVLSVRRLFKDGRIADEDKCVLALNLFCKGHKWRFLPNRYRTDLLNLIFKEIVQLPKKPTRQAGIKVIDFDLDSDYIYASFLQAYGIDLTSRIGRLHWKDFTALFGGLPEGTKIKEVMKIRSAELPSPTKYNYKERINLMELKSYYALPVEGGGGQDGLNALFHALEAQAK